MVVVQMVPFPPPRSPMGVAVGRDIGTLSVAGVLVCSTGLLAS